MRSPAPCRTSTTSENTERKLITVKQGSKNDSTDGNDRSDQACSSVRGRRGDYRLLFSLVLAIGWYLKGQSGTGEDFFMAGREMTAWIAGLSFLSANLGSLELMGWAAAAYQYGILATHWYWIGAIPAMLFLALVMMPFYYISKTH